MSFFDKIFDWIVDLSEKMPAVEPGRYYLIVMLCIAAAGIIIGLTFLASHAAVMRRACRRIINYLRDENAITDDNVADFTADCFGSKAPNALRDTWVEYQGVRFGYPSDVMSDASVFDKEVKRYDSVRANVFIAVALIAVAFFTFWGVGAVSRAAEIGVMVFAGLALSAVIYLVLCIVAKKQYKRAQAAFYEMQDELDAKVNLQVEKDYATEASPLLEIASIVEGIVAKNTAKPNPVVTEADIAEQTSDAADAPGSSEDAAVAVSEESVNNAEDSVFGGENACETKEVADSIADNDTEAADGNAAEKTPIEILAEGGETAVEDDGKDENAEGRVEDDAEEITDEDEESMFGRKKKKAVREELESRGYDNLVVEGELLGDDDGDGEEIAGKLVASAEKQGDMPESLDGLNISLRPTAADAVTVSLEPEVIYVEENLDEGDEDVKAPRLAKLPHFVDYVLTMNLSRSMKIKVATLMLQAYNVFKNSPENKAIVIQCMSKIIKSIMADQAAAKAAAAAAENATADVQEAAAERE